MQLLYILVILLGCKYNLLQLTISNMCQTFYLNSPLHKYSVISIYSILRHLSIEVTRERQPYDESQLIFYRTGCGLPKSLNILIFPE